MSLTANHPDEGGDDGAKAIDRLHRPSCTHYTNTEVGDRDSAKLDAFSLSHAPRWSNRSLHADRKKGGAKLPKDGNEFSLRF